MTSSSSPCCQVSWCNVLGGSINEPVLAHACSAEMLCAPGQCLQLLIHAAVLLHCATQRCA